MKRIIFKSIMNCIAFKKNDLWISALLKICQDLVKKKCLIVLFFNSKKTTKNIAIPTSCLISQIVITLNINIGAAI